MDVEYGFQLCQSVPKNGPAVYARRLTPYERNDRDSTFLTHYSEVLREVDAKGGGIYNACFRIIIFQNDSKSRLNW